MGREYLMLVAVCSVKGSPGVTSAALALTAAWPRVAVLVEADQAGADLAYRCRTLHGSVLRPTPSLLTLAAEVRGGEVGSPGLLLRHTQRLGCDVVVVPGIATSGQASGLAGLWGAIGDSFGVQGIDVVVDLGRLPPPAGPLPVVAAADVVVVVASASVESVGHLRDGLRDLPGRMGRNGPVPAVIPMLVVDDARAGECRIEVNQLLHDAGIIVAPTTHLAWDSKALRQLELGADPSGRLRRTLLMRSATGTAQALIEQVDDTDVSARVLATPANRASRGNFQ